MQIQTVSPAAPESNKGNSVTGRRWQRLLQELGHTARLTDRYDGAECDMLIALHARKSAAAAEQFQRTFPGRPLVVALTGTDLYQDLPHDPQANRSLELAWRLVVLQPEAVHALPEAVRHKARVILQSAEPPEVPPEPRQDRFEVCVLGHLRPVKDPFRTAEAARLLPLESRGRVLHAGAALSPDMAERARAEEAANPRYRWLGDLPRPEALRLLARCRLLSLTSHLEGGPSVISEALVAGVPVISTRIPGVTGMLGDGYAGYFSVGDTAALARLLRRAETDAAFYSELRSWCAERARLFHPNAERARWAELLAERESAGAP